jgi:hypothetical protein
VLTSVGAGNFCINTFLSFSTLFGQEYDLYLTPLPAAGSIATVGDNSDLTSLSPMVLGASPGNFSNFSAPLAQNSYRLRLAKAGASPGSYKEILFDSGNNGIQLAASSNPYTLLIYTVGSASLPTVMLIEANSGTAQNIGNQLVNVRVVHGVPNTRAVVNISIGTTGRTFPFVVGFGESCSYVTQTTSETAFTFIDESDINETPYLDYMGKNLIGGCDYCIYSIGSNTVPGSTTALLVEENNLLDVVGANAKFYFINGTPLGDIDVTSGLSTSTVDAFVGLDLLVTGLQAQTAQGAQSASMVVPFQGGVGFTAAENQSAILGQFITPGMSYTTVIRGQSVTLTAPAVAAGGIYCLALLGANGTYVPLLFQTNNA